MKKAIFVGPAVLAVFAGLAATIAAPQESETQKSLADAYRSGAIKFVPALTIDETALPKDVFLQRPSDIACDPQGNVYVVDMRACQIHKFDASGKFLKTIGRRGQGPGEFNSPSQIAAAKDRLLVYDSSNRRLGCLTVEGAFIKSKTIMTPTEGRPDGMRGLPNGDFVIGWEIVFPRDQNKPQDYSIRIFSPDLELKKTIYQQAIWRNKYGDVGGHFTNIIQPFSPLVSWDVTLEGKIIIGFAKSYEIAIYDSDQGMIGSFRHEYEPVKISEEDKKLFFRGITTISATTSADGTTTGSQTNELDNRYVNATEFPIVKPPFFDLTTDADGNILVWPHLKTRDDENKVFDAFSPEGRFLGVVREEKSRFISKRAVTPGGGIWSFSYDRDGIPSIVKYKIESAEK